MRSEAASSPADVVAAVGQRRFDLVLIDLNYARDITSGKEGLDLLADPRSLDPTLPIIVMTAWGTVDLAVEAMRRGARDFILKPWDNERLVAAVREHGSRAARSPHATVEPAETDGRATRAAKPAMQDMKPA